MVGHFQKAVAAGRARLAAGEAVAGLLGDMLAAVDDCGNRWVWGRWSVPAWLWWRFGGAGAMRQ